ncbi:uncharacterized protein LOC105006419 isoform X2 [Esox lucius]|uniref:uncharacterized protein LOC105006419 isoform X2 n=1 Tax=Esox lucius TaxID=8010 RepID=UPI001476866E|nr:uncharacterized protein LOC105006419 isoform X2 [Esox lucius]
MSNSIELSLKKENTSSNSQTGVMAIVHKVNPFKSSTQASTVSTAPVFVKTGEGNLSDSKQLRKEDSHADTVDQETLPEGQPNPGLFTGMMQRVNPFKTTAKPQLKKENPTGDTVDHLVTEKLPEDKRNPGMFSGMMQRVNPFKSTAQNPVLNEGQPTDTVEQHVPDKETKPLPRYSSSSSDSLDDINFSPSENPTVWYTDNDAMSSATSEHPLPEQTGNVDAQAAAQGGVMDIQTLELTAVPVTSEGSTVDSEEDVDSLLDWWKTVEGWETWNESNTFEEDEGEIAVVAVADRVFLAARLFVRLFNQRGCSLQRQILELLSLSDAADSFHKKTVTARVGGGVASIAGSITTITGLILAPFTMGTSLIVTAVGIGVATAGGVTSASANITDTVHSKTDRKKVEKMIQDYQEEIKDIKECLEFLQVGMQTLEEWDFDQYVESISKKHLNQNVKHVVKEGGRAGKALLINTENLISTVQVLNVAGGAAKAAQVISITTGVMSGLFLALDVFFLAKDSIELNKGAKTEFAGKIREVCKELQNGLLELNRIKEQLQKTMDGVEVEEEEEEDEEGDKD